MAWVGALECDACDGCGWCEGTPAATCVVCNGTGVVCGACRGSGERVTYKLNERTGRLDTEVLGACETCEGSGQPLLQMELT